MPPERFIVVLLSAAISVLTIALVFNRLFGVLFFWPISMWAAVPAFVIIALLLATRLRKGPRRLLASTLLLWYLLSVYFDGWHEELALMSKGVSVEDAVFQLTEVAVIALFALFCFLPRDQVDDD